MTGETTQFQFQAETKKLLGLMINSLYTDKEIFLRELISNSSDAIDRLRFESLTNPELLPGNEKFEIRIETNLSSRTLTLSDNGLGMTRDEVIKNIGTIARSGTEELRNRMNDSPPGEVLSEMIGKFGVGFYSVFMVADKVVLITRRAGEKSATLWESTGDGHYTLSECERATHGASVTLHLKPFDTENGIEDFTDKWIIARIVKKYSDFVNYPIIFKESREEVEINVDGTTKIEGEQAITVEDKALNSMRPLWTRPQAEVSESEYAEFYKRISHDWDEPFETILLKAEGRFERQALLFIPSKTPEDLYYHAADHGLRLYAKRVMIMERCANLLPRYLRFIKGVVDSADLPLNISRQMLQQDRHITLIRKWLTKKVLDRLAELFGTRHERYVQFWKRFGRALKEGVGEDYDNKDKIVALLMFETSDGPGKLTTLQGYVERMKEGQEDIFYFTGESRNVIENSPHLEAFKEKGYEVLFLTDPVDELLVQSLTEFQGRKLKSGGKGVVWFGSREEKELAEKEIKQKEEACSKLLGHFQEILDKDVKQVRLSNRLTTSPACLVGNEMDYSPQLERLLQKGKGGGAKQRRILELNPKHPIFIKMHDHFGSGADNNWLNDYAELLLGHAFIAEGAELPDPIRFNKLVADLMARTL